jgi:hypothetical protein
METNTGIETPQTEQEESEPSAIENPAQETEETSDIAATDESAADEGQATEGEGEQRPEQPKVVKELIHTRKRAQQAEQEAAYWRGVAEGLIKPDTQPQTQQPQGDVPPDRYEFDSDEDYQKAMIRYEVRQEIKKETEQIRLEAERTRMDKTFAQRIQEAAKTDPELLNIVRDPTVPISEAMAYHIKSSELGPQIVRYLSNNRNEASRLMLLHPIQAAAELGKIEAKLSQPPPETKKVSQAPEPAKPVGSNRGASNDVDLDKIPIDEYMKRRNQEQYSRR